MKIIRSLVPLLVLLSISGCDRTPNELFINNVGTSTAVVSVDYHKTDGSRPRHVHQDFTVDAGRFIVGEYHRLDSMDVVITRQSDGVLLFQASYDQKDFDDEHGRIDILVNP